MEKQRPRKVAGSRTSRTSTPSRAWERTGLDRVYKRVGSRRVSFIYKHLNTSETLASAALGDRAAINEAWRLARVKAAALLEGKVTAGSVAEGIERFELVYAPKHFIDQSKNGKDDRKAQFKALTSFFGAMNPRALRQTHGYQYLTARADAGAPERGKKEMAMMTTICHYFVRDDLMERNPFTDMRYSTSADHGDDGKPQRSVSRRQVLRFYLWSLRQRQNYRTLGCAAMFTYLTGYRASEVRPFQKSGLRPDGAVVLSAKRKKGQKPVEKVRNWSRKLRCVVARALDRTDPGRLSPYLFAPSRARSACYSRSGWGSSWQDAMNAWIRTRDTKVKEGDLVTDHALYFALQDIRPAAITRKLAQRAPDAYDFAAHANPETTHRHYDRRTVKRADATE
ncbi:hypothetical protein AVE30378_02511 [Achromobacter veterisilvae]|uniref:Tyr recombinase domain-containing protein n=1 Tax=Achromobacter veterisilvae TaxID=2069367 RepID=A0A446CH81_9BURK|nr:hypothetical protein [Achromobacter veterisilvae]SSW67222.1 hypothetical protein AVE30378_02511 [Achromobacter veterisilvae]